MVDALNGDIQITDKAVEVRDYKGAIYLQNGKLSFYGDSFAINGLVPAYNENEEVNIGGSMAFAGWQDGNSNLTIDANAVYIGQEGTGDRGFQFKNANNILTVHADTFVAYVGDSLINAQGDNSESSVASFGTADNRIDYFEAHGTWGKNVSYTSLLQVNEGNTVNLYANDAILTGPGADSQTGGVIGTGTYGIINVDVTDQLVIDGNICGTYGGVDNRGKTAEFNVHAGSLDMKGNINIGSEGIWNNDANTESNFSRNTILNLTVDGNAKIDGDINIKGNKVNDAKDTSGNQSVLNLELNGDSVITGTINAVGSTGTDTQVNLGGTGDMTASSGKFNAEDNGNINFTGGTWAVNEWTGGDGNLSIGKDATVEVNDNITVSKVVLENGSKTIINWDKLEKESAAITATDTTNSSIGDTADIQINGIDTNTTMKLFDSTALNQAAKNNIHTDNVLQDITVSDDGTLSVGTVASDKAHKVLAGSLLTDVALYATKNNVDGVTALLTGENDVEALNSAAGLSAMAGVEHGTYTAAGIFNDAVAGHLMNRNDEDVWAYGFHNKENVNGLSFGADYDAQYNGAVAGVDLYRNGGTVAGIALSYADGNVSGSNGFASTQNDADYYGASLYARFDRGTYALLGDISYMKGDHDVTQWNKGQQITASPDSDAVSVGVKAVKDFTAGESGTLTPYIGVRYLRLSTDGFTAYNASYSGDDQDLVLIPVGVNYSAAITGGSWTFRPYAGVGYIWNAGDKSADQTVTLGTAANSFSYDTVDSGSFLTRVGFTADHGDMSYGVGYSYQKGDSVSNNAWTLSASFRF